MTRNGFLFLLPPIPMHWIPIPSHLSSFHFCDYSHSHSIPILFPWAYSHFLPFSFTIFVTIPIPIPMGLLSFPPILIYISWLFLFPFSWAYSHSLQFPFTFCGYSHSHSIPMGLVPFLPFPLPRYIVDWHNYKRQARGNNTMWLKLGMHKRVYYNGTSALFKTSTKGWILSYYTIVVNGN